MTGWRIPLRIARREAMRSRGRSLLMLVMIALPVMGVTAADVLIATQNVSSVESLNRRLGTGAAAEVTPFDGFPITAVHQGIDPDNGFHIGDGRSLPAPTLASVLTAIGGNRAGVETITSYPEVLTKAGAVDTFATEFDPASPLTHGLFRLVSGRWPRTTDEVVVNQALDDRRPAGETLTLVSLGRNLARSGYVTRKVVGIAESASARSQEILVGLPGSVPVPAGAQHNNAWYIGGSPVTWNDVEKVNAIGALVVSRSEILHPSAAARSASAQYGDQPVAVESKIAVAVLIAMIALIEVVLLAGPAFAVGARRQARSLALLAASGGTPQQARRVVLATGVVIGTVGSAVGVVLGIAAARLFQPVLQGHSDTWFGPFQVVWGHVAAVAGFGLLSALLAAVVPAWIASRQDVVAVLQGRRGDRRPSTRSPYVGLVLVAAGVVLAVVATHQSQLAVAVALSASAICCVLGMIFLVPVVVVGVGRLGRRLPLPLRFAVRDAARHRTRTTPAIAAVAASVMGVVTLCIGVSSNTAAQSAGYRASLPSGVASISVTNGYQAPWDAYARAVAQGAPGVVAQPIVGVPFYPPSGSTTSFFFEHQDGTPIKQDAYGYSLGADVLVYDGDVPKVVSDLGDLGAAARAMLASGGAVVFTSTGAGSARITIRTDVHHDNAAAVSLRVAVRDVNALLVTTHHTPAVAIISTSLARRLRLHPTTIELVTAGPTISRSQEQNITERLNVVVPEAFPMLYVERGFQPWSGTWIRQVILIALGALLMLGGTLTATFLALSDARPDLATLSAVGAAPRTRRAVAAAYALAVGGIGALLGAALGFIPGIAVTYPLTAKQQASCNPTGCTTLPPLHWLDVPWLQIGGVVVLLPLLVAAVVWVAARSRLPLVSRLS